MATNNKLKAWVRYEGQKKIVPGSLILQANKPKVGTWREVPTSLCCDNNNNNNCNGQPLTEIAGTWYLLDAYAPPFADGFITLPNHCGSTYSLNPSLVGNNCVQFYINVYNFEEDIQTLLLQMVGNAGCLNVTQGECSVTYSFTDKAWEFAGDSPIVLFDSAFGTAPLGSLVVTSSTCTGNWDPESPITISLNII